MLQVKKNNYVHEKYFLCTFSMDLLYFRCSETEKKKYLKVHARVSDNLWQPFKNYEIYFLLNVKSSFWRES